MKQTSGRPHAGISQVSVPSPNTVTYNNDRYLLSPIYHRWQGLDSKFGSMRLRLAGFVAIWTLTEVRMAKMVHARGRQLGLAVGWEIGWGWEYEPLMLPPLTAWTSSMLATSPGQVPQEKRQQVSEAFRNYTVSVLTHPVEQGKSWSQSSYKGCLLIKES